MKLKFNDSFLGRNSHLLITAAWLFTISFIINNYWSGTSTPFAVQKQVQKHLIKKEHKIGEFLKDSLLLHSIASGNLNEEELNVLVNEPFFIYFYEVKPFVGDVPIFWNTQVVEPNELVLHQADGDGFYKLLNGWYAVRKTSFEGADGRLFKIACLIPVKWDYYIQNQYLHNSFEGVENAEKSYDISLEPTGLPIRNSFRQTLFYLVNTQPKLVQQDNRLALWLKIAGALLVLVFIHNLAGTLVKKRGFGIAFLFLASTLVILRTISYFFPFPFNFHQLELFDPEIYSFGYLLPSLGDLFINSLLFLWLVFFILYHFRYNYNRFPFKKYYHRYFAVAILSFFVFGLTLLGGNIIRSLVSDSQISFDVINFFSLNKFSVFGFIILCSVSTAYFFLIQIILHPVNVFLKREQKMVYLFISVCGLILLSLQPKDAAVAFNISLLLWLLLFIYFLNLKVLFLQAYHLISSRFIFWLFFFSVSITVVIVIENKSKELGNRKQFAINLANKADPSGPVIMNIVLTDFRNEYLSDIFYKFKRARSNRKLKDSLINENFSGYLNKYETKIYTFDDREQPLFNEDSVSFNDLNAIIQSQGKPTGVPDLYYYDISYDRFNYIARKEIVDTTEQTQGFVFLVSSPKQYKTDALYPELFSKGNKNSIESSTIYAFAIYNKNKLSTSYNDYPFSTEITDKEFSHNEFKVITRDGYEELWYKANADKVIVITRQDRFFIESLTLFAYLFCSFLLLTVVFNLVILFLGDRRKGVATQSFWRFTIRNQVHGTIIFISVLSFLVIGVTTILFFISRYHNNNREKLSRTIHVMENELRNTVQPNVVSHFLSNRMEGVSTENLEKIINNVSDIHATEINLYDLQGNLRISSVPLPYQRGIVSEKMDPVAYFHLSELKDAQFFQQQQIGNLKYLSNYLPVRDENGREYAYLNIPYFESQNKLQDEISNFLVTIINLNAFIFLIAGIIALFITNTITRSFSIISDRMRQVNLQTSNEEIEWKRNDEIGVLVKEYNKMVRQLEVSAEKLARSEREGAWREMARQVAHEIKNPLTPMKLNLQYLQMAIDKNSSDVKNISLYVANILLEQIEHLSQIASDFAQFANISNIKKQVFNINDTLENIITLYSTNDEIEIEDNLYKDEIFIEGDKTQVNRLFTNLLQNAVQAVPEFRKANIVITSKLEKDKVMISVKDNGNGIPESMKSKIFAPNFTTKTSGTGLGLAMCRGIVEKLNGKIWFETKEGEWTIFYVEIPLSKCPFQMMNEK